MSDRSKHQDVEIPARMRAALHEDAHLAGTTLALLAQISALLSDNSTPFFPGYTDHGYCHVNAVLEDMERLVPEQVWRSGHWRARDSAIAVVACLLHDLAMHMQEEAFCLLIERDGAPAPMRWFHKAQGARLADIPWADSWQAFQSEVRRWPRSRLIDLLGSDQYGAPQVIYTTTLDRREWTMSDRLVIGEFIRRHHPRIAHEIALYGFPGLHGTDLTVPAELAELAGTVARSHGEPLRVMVAYVRYSYGTDIQPGGALIVYLMALLRIADYLQLGPERAPAILLRLKTPMSRRSVEEWMNHRAISNISWYDRDPHAIRIELSTANSLVTQLNIERLLAGLQSEMDATTAVLSEVYGGSALGDLRMSRYRVVSNLDSEGFRTALPYEPVDARLRIGEELFPSLLGPLYGDEAVIAGRELLQNAVDAVRLRWALKGQNEQPQSPLGASVDILVSLERIGEGYRLTVADCGIGMTPAVVVQHFLTAGLSYGPAEALAEGHKFVNRHDVIKAGRFGIGMFAGFIFGSTIQVNTRHIDADRGLTFAVNLDGGLIELRRTDCPIGTTIIIDHVDSAQHEALNAENFMRELRAYYCLSEPSVRFMLHGKVQSAGHDCWVVPPEAEREAQGWRETSGTALGKVHWAYAPQFAGSLAHNGMAVQRPQHSRQQRVRIWEWQDSIAKEFLDQPVMAVADPDHAARLSLDRYALIDRVLPIEKELILAIGRDLVACALTTQTLTDWKAAKEIGGSPLLLPITSKMGWFPLLPTLSRGLGCGRFLLVRSRYSLAIDRFRKLIDFEWVAEAESHGLGGPGAGRPPTDDAMARLAGLQPVASYMTSTYIVPNNEDAKARGPDLAEIAGRQRIVSAWSSSRAWQAVTEELRHSTRRYLEGEPDNDLVLVAYAGETGGTRRETHELAVPWLEIVGGAMPWAREERAAMLTECAAEDSPLASSLRSWEHRHRRRHG
ncbi:MAG: hypothetical protein ACLP01_13095 [Solirubrobacteraceae bacterium]